MLKCDFNGVTFQIYFQDILAAAFDSCYKFSFLAVNLVLSI